jgi:hypothetical protein
VRSCSEWLTGMLSVRGLDAPDGRMLFSYRLSAQEYEQLKQLVAGLARPSSLQSWAFRERDECAAFVLYASEWWKRSYDGGPWRWSLILDSLSVGHVELPPDERTYAVERGLRRWGHKPLDSGKKFFGAFVAQGGLPLPLISRGAGALSNLLIEAFRQAARFRWEQAEIADFVEDHGDLLVQHLRHPEIYLLLARIVSTVLEIRNEFHLAGVPDPVASLDAGDPKWRERFPIAVDDGAAEQLVIGLIRAAAKETIRQGQTTLIVERHLNPDVGATFELASAVMLPRLLEVRTLAQIFGIREEMLPRYFAVDVIADTRESLAEARQLLGSDVAMVAMSSRATRFRGEVARQEHLVVLRTAQGDLGAPVAVPGGETLDADVPWIFARRGERWRLVATCSCRLPDSEVLVVVPANVVFSESSACPSPQRIGELVGCDAPFEIYRVTSGLTFGIGGAQFRVTTAQAVGEPDRWLLSGKRPAYATRPMPMFFGVPRLYRIGEDGSAVRVRDAELGWFAAGHPQHPVGDVRAWRGPVDLWVTQHGARITRFRFVLESPDANLQFVSGAVESEGALILNRWACQHVAVEGVDHSVLANAGQPVRVNVTVAGRPPASIDILLWWRGSKDAVKMAVPFPATGGRFFDADGAPLDNGVALTSDKLLGTRLRVFDRNPQSPKRYLLNLTLETRATSGGKRQLARQVAIPVDQTGIGELRLMDVEGAIQSLLSYSDELDAQVVAAICANEQTTARLRITRYDLALDREGLCLRLSESALRALTVERLAALKMLALPMAQGRQEPREIPQGHSSGVPSGSWQLDHLAFREGPWLVYPAKDSSIKFRPVLHVPPAPTGAVKPSLESACPLGRAMAVGSVDARRTLIDQALSEMASDLDHRSWGLIEAHWQHLSHLPLSTLDSWRALAKNHAACLACLLRFSQDASILIRRLRDELGVVWELEPSSAWIAAADHLCKYWSNQMGGASADTRITSTVADHGLVAIRSELPTLATAIDLARFQMGIDVANELAGLHKQLTTDRKQLLASLWHGHDSLAQRYLFRAHAEDMIWPNFRLSERASAALFNALEGSLVDELKRDANALFWVPSKDPRLNAHHDFRVDVANIPSICALWSTSGVSTDWWADEVVALQLKQIRAFDPLWFEEAYKQAVKVCMAFGIGMPGGKHATASKTSALGEQRPTGTHPSSAGPRFGAGTRTIRNGNYRSGQ